MSRSRQKRRDQLELTSKNSGQTRFFYAIVGLILVVAVGIGAYTYFNQPPEVSEDRLQLDAAIGPQDAEVTIYEFGAYGCHSCRRVHQSGFNQRLLNLLEQDPYQGRVRFVFVNFPVISPAIDPISAEVAQCALDQGQEAFWTFHDAVFDLSDSEYAGYDEAAFVELAARYDLDTEALQTCLDNDTHVRTVEYHEQRARDRFVQATPTFFVNDQRIGGADFVQIENAVAAALN